MRNRLALVALLVLFVVLAVLALVTTPESPPEATEAPTVTPTSEFTPEPTVPEGSLLRVFPDLKVLDIQAIQLEDLSADRKLTLVRDLQGNWTAPDLEDDLDVDAATNIARTLVLFPYGRSINIVPDTDFKDYGLSPQPQLLFTILIADNNSHIIAVGDLIDSGEAYYTLVDDRDEIFQVERGAVDFLRNLILDPPIRLTK